MQDAPRRGAAGRPVAVASRLGVVQILTWGSTYYLLAILAEPIASGTGWSRATVAAGLSVALLASGLVAVRVGRLVRKYGGRPVLAGAVLLIVAGLSILSASSTRAVYFAAWLVIGIGMGGALYDAAFATLGRLFGEGARRAITILTLWGGFASTVCWPLSAVLVESVGWRGACLAYAATHIVVTLPLTLYGLPREAPAEGSPRGGAPGEGDTPRDLRFWLLATAAIAIAAVTSAWSVHLVTILQAQGLALAAAVGAAALIGPAQVGARLGEMALGDRHHPAWTGMVSTALVSAGLVGLLFDAPAGIALVAYGAGNGLWSIARGTMPLALFGHDAYPLVIGRIARPALITAAAAPVILAWVMERYGTNAALAGLVAASLVALGCAAALARLRRVTPTPPL